jgi:hypothetical protein
MSGRVQCGVFQHGEDVVVAHAGGEESVGALIGQIHRVMQQANNLDGAIYLALDHAVTWPHDLPRIPADVIPARQQVQGADSTPEVRSIT